MSVSFTSRAKGCIKFVPHSFMVSLSHKVGVFLEEAICYFIDTGYEYKKRQLTADSDINSLLGVLLLLCHKAK
jgi:hypothetical protein